MPIPDGILLVLICFAPGLIDLSLFRSLGFSIVWSVNRYRSAEAPMKLTKVSNFFRPNWGASCVVVELFFLNKLLIVFLKFPFGAALEVWGPEPGFCLDNGVMDCRVFVVRLRDAFLGKIICGGVIRLEDVMNLSTDF